MLSSRRALSITLALALASGSAAALAGTATAADVATSSTAVSVSAGTIVVSPTGSDTNAGTVAAPVKSLAKAFSMVRAGGTVLVRGGTYAQQIVNPAIAQGTASAPITVTAYPGETPVISGLLWLKDASYWKVSGLTVTWSAANNSSQHMVKITGGTGWSLTGNTFHGARSFAALLVAGNATNWQVSGNTIRDTYMSNSTNQDHLIYVNSTGANGLIERNVLTNSPNGRAIKVGPPAKTSGAVEGGLTIRYNTMRDNLGPSNVQLAWQTSNVSIYNNIMVRPASNRSAVTAYDLTGKNNVVRDNVSYQAVRTLDAATGLIDGGGNKISEPTSFVGSYGATAGQSTPSTPTSLPTVPTVPTVPVATAPAPVPTSTAPATTTQAPAPTSTAPTSTTPTTTAPTTTAPAPAPTTAPTASAPTTSSVTFVGSVKTSSASTAAMGVSTVTGVKAGDLMLASVLVRGDATVTAPTGWTTVRNNSMTGIGRLVTFSKVAGSTESSKPVFALSTARPVTAVMNVYRNAKVGVSAAAVDAASVTKINAPSVTTTQEATIVTVAGVSVRTTVSPAAGMTERAEISTPSTASQVATLETADTKLAAGASGAKVATAAAAGAAFGQTIALYTAN